MEFFRLGIVYLHLIACCVAIGLILTSDVRMLKQLFNQNDPPDKHDAHIDSLKYAVSNALIVLWVTGMALIALDASENGVSYFYNPKLQAKVGIVILLTINGFFLHAAILPALKKAGSLLDLKLAMRVMAIFTGAVSATSWFYAALLGIGRPLAWKYSVIELLAAYPVLIACGFCMVFLLTFLANYGRRSTVSTLAKA